MIPYKRCMLASLVVTIFTISAAKPEDEFVVKPSSKKISTGKLREQYCQRLKDTMQGLTDALRKIAAAQEAIIREIELVLDGDYSRDEMMERCQRVEHHQKEVCGYNKALASLKI